MTRVGERILLVTDAVLVAVCFLGSYLIRFWSGWFSTYNWTREGHYLIALPVFSILYLSSLWFFGGYETRRPTSPVSQAFLSLRGAALASLTFLSLVFWYRFFSFSRVVMVLNGVSLVLLSAVVRWGVHGLISRLRLHGFDPANALVITSNGNGDGIRGVLESHPERGYRVQRTVPLSEIRHRGSSVGSALYSILDQYKIEDVFIDLGSAEKDQAAEIIDQCRQEPVRLHFALELYREIRSHPRWRVVDEEDWFTLERTSWDRLSREIKRATDIIVAGTVLIVTAPLMALIAAGIRLTSPGPIIFKQRRAGLNGRPFTIYKFRSMVEEAESQLDEIIDVDSLPEPVFKPENDPRVTWFGKWLRRFSLDELPQFWNVLKGEMSLVGPRPEELWIVERYDEPTRARLRVKPGITGYQQIRCRGLEDMAVRLSHDLYYIDHQSIFFDLYIILQTLLVVISGRGRI